MAALSAWWRKHDRAIAPYLFVAPFLVLFFVFSIYPVLYSLYLSFFKATGLSSWQFIGLENYADLLSDRRFIKSVTNTSYYAAASVFLLSPLALLVAVGFNAGITRQLRGLYRVAYFVPVITSAVVIAMMFRMIFDEQYGLLNAMLGNVGIEPIPWLRSKSWAMPAIVVLGIWTYLGVNALYFLAGLQNIPHELTEAAAIDGANGWQTFFYITMPILRPVIMFVVVQAIIGSYNLFAQPLLLTNGGPQDATLFMTIYLYQVGFQQFKLGYASAIGYTLVLIVFTLSLINLLFFGAFRSSEE
jgi:ABC-type sugar transport system permease subunit